ncbi:hypothetical protein D3C73_940970 [compost metagenome]
MPEWSKATALRFQTSRCSWRGAFRRHDGQAETADEAQVGQKGVQMMGSFPALGGRPGSVADQQGEDSEGCEE